MVSSGKRHSPDPHLELLLEQALPGAGSLTPYLLSSVGQIPELRGPYSTSEISSTPSYPGRKNCSPQAGSSPAVAGCKLRGPLGLCKAEDFLWILGPQLCSHVWGRGRR